MTIADRIREKRIELNLSQTELAKKAGYSDKTAISKLENAGNNITMKQIKRLAKALDTTSSYLMGWNTTETDDEAEQELRAKRILELYKTLPADVLDDSKTLDDAINIINRYEQLPPEKKLAFQNYLKFLQSDV